MTVETAILYDCEFLTAAGAPQRFWCGPHDPDPVVAQIGAVKLGLTADAPILERYSQIVEPVRRDGSAALLDPLFERLTGVTQDRITSEGVPLIKALTQLEEFADGAPFWSWGKDEFNMLAISCYVAGITPPIPAIRFGNAARLAVLAGVPAETVHTLRSPGLPAFFEIETPKLQAHDALGDAEAVAYCVQHLIQTGRLDPQALAHPRRRLEA